LSKNAKELITVVQKILNNSYFYYDVVEFEPREFGFTGRELEDYLENLLNEIKKDELFNL